MEKCIVSAQNAEHIKNLFENFLESVRDTGRVLEIKNVWGKPKENETWDGLPYNRKFSKLPQIGNHRDPRFILAIIFTSVEDHVKHCFGGVREWYDEHYEGRHVNKGIVNAASVEIGDEVCVDDLGITVVPIRKEPALNKICSWRLCINS